MQRWSLFVCALGLGSAVFVPIRASATPVVITKAETAEQLPWREAGWTERQAAAHLLDRFAFGARPGDIDRVQAVGLEQWLDQQLAGDLDDGDVTRRLAGLESLQLTTHEIADRYPHPAQVARSLMAEGKLDPATPQRSERDGAIREAVVAETRARGLRPQRELVAELYVQKLLRGIHGTNQLHEVLTDFWFNHFNVSITDNDVRALVTTYERDAIRPEVTGQFRRLLEATARHPAMLMYLDNARSTANKDAPRRFDVDSMRRRTGRRTVTRDPRAASNRSNGLNENYARELLELHTLGVDGGYSQHDIVEVARAFTGWTVLPTDAMMDEGARRRLSRARRVPSFVIDGAFLFRADLHDAGPKAILGVNLPAGGGIEDGQAVLDLLATHPATARHIARKLAIRFVADTPPEALVERLARRFLDTGGDLGAVIRALAHDRAFWSDDARRQKIKSPFELAVSAVRALDAEVTHPRELLSWISEMGQPLYAYQAPTGFPDRADAWVNTGSLLARMRFGLALGSGQVRGVRFDLIALTGGREPDSVEAALFSLVSQLLPGVDPAAVTPELLSLIHDPDVSGWLVDDVGKVMQHASGQRHAPLKRGGAEPPPTADHGMLGRVAGVLLGAPAFQRR